MKVTLVSFAEGEPFASVRSKLNESAAGAGFDAVQLWSMADFLAAPLTRQLWPSMETLRSLQHRPFCDAFKMIALLHAMERSEENDYVMWVDSSRHFPYPLKAGSVHAGIARLNAGATSASPRSMYGRINCVMPKGAAELALPVAPPHPAGAFAPYFASRRPSHWIVACQLLLANTRFNRRLVREWLGMAVHQPRAFCGHPTEDNYALVALACNHSLPAIISHPTLQLETSPKHFMWAPLSPQFLLESLEAGAFSVVRNGCGGQLVRDACRSWLHDARSRRLRLTYEPREFFDAKVPRQCTNDTRWAQAIRTAIEAGGETEMDFVGPCAGGTKATLPRTVRHEAPKMPMRTARSGGTASHQKQGLS